MQNLLSAALILFVSAMAWSQDYPRRPVRFDVPYAAGATNHAVARMLGQPLNEIWPHPLVVDNRSGGGTIVATESFESMAGPHVLHVPCEGDGPAIADTIAGQIHMNFATPLELTGQLTSGRLEALAASSTTRACSLPDLPTMAEGCGPGGDAAPVWGVAVPAATPEPVVDRLHAPVVGLLRPPDIVAHHAAQGVETAASSHAEATSHVQAEPQRWAKAVKSAQTKVD